MIFTEFPAISIRSSIKFVKFFDHAGVRNRIVAGSIGNIPDASPTPRTLLPGQLPVNISGLSVDTYMPASSHMFFSVQNCSDTDVQLLQRSGILNSNSSVSSSAACPVYRYFSRYWNGASSVCLLCHSAI